MRISDWISDVCSSDLADRIGAQRVHQAQRFQRLAAAVDQVAAEPQPVARRVEGDPVEQALRRFETTLQVANFPDVHATATVPCLNAGSAASTGGMAGTASRGRKRVRTGKRWPGRFELVGA